MSPLHFGICDSAAAESRKWWQMKLNLWSTSEIKKKFVLTKKAHREYKEKNIFTVQSCDFIESCGNRVEVWTLSETLQHLYSFLSWSASLKLWDSLTSHLTLAYFIVDSMTARCPGNAVAKQAQIITPSAPRWHLLSRLCVVLLVFTRCGPEHLHLGLICPEHIGPEVLSHTSLLVF